MQRYPTTTDEEREAAVEAASLAIQRGALVVLPTDTVYGLAADAFDKDSVQELLDAKGRGRDMPPPVLVSAATTLDALAVRVPTWARALVEEFWPGALTLVCHAHSSLQWDLGDTRGTVAVRMPDHPVALEILERTGPLAVSSANLTRPARRDRGRRGRGDAGRRRRGHRGRRYVAGRLGLDHRRRHPHPRPGAAARRGQPRPAQRACWSRWATPSPIPTRPPTRRTPARTEDSEDSEDAGKDSEDSDRGPEAPEDSGA